MQLDRDFFERFLIRHRRILVALLLATIAWLIAGNLAGATSVVMVNAPITSGSLIDSQTLSVVEVRGTLPEGYINDVEQISGYYSNQNLVPGMVLLSSHLTSTPSDSNRLVASLPLEAGDNTLYQPGASVRVWAISDEGVFLITENAVVISTEQSVSENNRVTLAFDEASEYRLMQAFALRLVLNQA